MEKITGVFATFIALLLGIFAIMIYKNNNIEIMDTNDYWTVYDESIKNIENNMNSITKSNADSKWGELKDINTEDKEYIDTLNSLVADVRLCYLGYTDDKKIYDDSNPIRKYRNKNKITKTKLQNLGSTMKEENESYSNTLEKYTSLKISNSKELQDRVHNLTNNIIELNSKMYATTAISYNELLLRKIYEVHSLEDISNFLVSEYNRLSNI